MQILVGQDLVLRTKQQAALSRQYLPVPLASSRRPSASDVTKECHSAAILRFYWWQGSQVTLTVRCVRATWLA